MRLFIALITLVLVGACFFCPSPLGAAEEKEKEEKPAETAGEEKKEEAWEPTTTDPLIADSAYVSDPGAFTLQTFAFYSFLEGAYNNNARYHRFKGEKHRTLVNFNQLSVGIWKNLELNLAVPYVYNWAEVPHQVGRHGDIGDVAAWLKYRLVEEDPQSWKPSVAALFQVKAPTGRYRHGNPKKLETDITGNGSPEITFGFNVSKRIEPVVLHANLWYDVTLPFRDQGKSIDVGDIIFWNLAAEWVLHERIVLLGELNGSYQFHTHEGRKRIPDSNAYLLNTTVGLEFILHKHKDRCFFAVLGLSVPLLGKNANWAITPVASIGFSF